VNIAAAVVSEQAAARAKSGRPLALIPAATAEKENPLGGGKEASEYPRFLYLQLYQHARGFRKDGKGRQLAPHHRHFVAAMQTRADAAVFVNFVWKIFPLRDSEAQMGKEIRLTGEQANAVHLVFLGLFEQRFDQSLAATTALGSGIYRDRPDLRQVLPVEMQGASTNNSP